MQKATIKDVAREAGVSVATASNAINNAELVRPQTRRLVMEAVERLGYVPNANGQRLRKMQSRSIGLFIDTIKGEYYGALADSVQKICQENHYDLNICIASDTLPILQKLREGSIDGAIIFHHGLDQKARQKIKATEAPVVFLDVEERGARVSSLLYESRLHGRMAASYLLGLGKRRLMHVFGLRGGYDSEMRRQGFLEELARQGIPENGVMLLEGKLDQATAFHEMRHYLKLGKPLPDAIFAANDLSAIGCIQALMEAGYRVPEDVSIIGCDDIPLCEYIEPGLTTIRTNFQTMGRRAAQEALRLIRGGEGRILIQNGCIVVRQSCAISPAQTGKAQGLSDQALAGGSLNLSEEMAWDEPHGNEVW